LSKTHVAVYTFGVSYLWTIKPSDYRHTAIQDGSARNSFVKLLHETFVRNCLFRRRVRRMERSKQRWSRWTSTMKRNLRSTVLRLTSWVSVDIRTLLASMKLTTSTANCVSVSRLCNLHTVPFV